MGDENESTRDYLYRESRNISHSDAILDMAIMEVSNLDAMSSYDMSPLITGASSTYSFQNDFMRDVSVPVLITCGRDGTVKLWR